MKRFIGLLVSGLCLNVTLITHLAYGEGTGSGENKPPLPKIADEPKTIDPAALMPASLAAPANHDFSDSSLHEMVEWLQKDRQMVVLLDKDALAGESVSPAEQISDRLVDTPIYLMLNRLRSLNVAWYFEDEVLHLTSAANADQRATTQSYNVTDLLDAGYDIKTVQSVITGVVDPESWEDNGGTGALSSLGDVVFVRQNDQRQRDVQGLLVALRQHGRQTFVNDPPQHLKLREQLQEIARCDFQGTPLEAAVEQLSAATQLDIRLDRPALQRERIREREPVTLTLTDRKLETILQALTLDLKLTWILRDGVLWITTPEQASSQYKVAIYDVRDLCRDEPESEALIGAILSQAEPESWSSVDGEGEIEAARPGTIVIRNRERTHMAILTLLEAYRSALRASRPRQRAGEDPNEVVTVYYRMHEGMASDLAKWLPKMVQPKSWNLDTALAQSGWILSVSSEPKFVGDDSVAEDEERPVGQLLPRSVLIIRQTREVHAEIEEIVRRAESGDPRSTTLSGLGGGGGGFGGGFFSVDDGLKPTR